jgi:hypothetical protein
MRNKPILVLAALAVSCALAHAKKEGTSMSRRRRLLQPFRLGVPDSELSGGF